MLKTTSMILLATAVILSQVDSAWARGGGGGGFRGGGGGGFRGGFGGYRGGGFDGGYRGGGFDGGYRGGFEGGDRGFEGEGRAGGLERAETFSPAERAGEFGNRGGDFRLNADSARNLTPAGNITRQITPNSLASRGNTVRNNFWHNDYFNHSWWRNHPGAWFGAGWGWGTAWGLTDWAALGGWYGWDDVQPAYYDYGTNITYQGDQVLYGDTPVASAAQYYEQASNLAQSDPASSGTDDAWTALGVFGLVQGEQASASAVFQLATNKAGAIAGNFNDMLSGNTLVVHGAVDPKNQRAAWTVGDNKNTVYETGIYNLTKQETPVLVHFGQDRTQQWTLVRLKQPDTAQQPNTAQQD